MVHYRMNVYDVNKTTINVKATSTRKGNEASIVWLANFANTNDT
jgi:hypothetical protein